MGIKGGVCIKHGAEKKEKKRCSSEGCTNQVQKGGVCKKHGATVKAVKRKTLGDDESANKKCKSKLQ